METVARIVTRGIDDDKTDVIIGVCFKNQTVLKPNRVYEIREILGELTLCDVGESVIGQTIEESFHCNTCWGQTINDVLESSKYIWLTRREMVSEIKNLPKKVKGR